MIDNGVRSSCASGTVDARHRPQERRTALDQSREVIAGSHAVGRREDIAKRHADAAHAGQKEQGHAESCRQHRQRDERAGC
jgi:hypothetical protein